MSANPDTALLPFVLTPAADGVWTITSPDLPGMATATIGLADVPQAIEPMLNDWLEEDPLPQPVGWLPEWLREDDYPDPQLPQV